MTIHHKVAETRDPILSMVRDAAQAMLLDPSLADTRSRVDAGESVAALRKLLDAARSISTVGYTQTGNTQPEAEHAVRMLERLYGPQSSQ